MKCSNVHSNVNRIITLYKQTKYHFNQNIGLTAVEWSIQRDEEELLTELLQRLFYNVPNSSSQDDVQRKINFILNATNLITY